MNFPKSTIPADLSTFTILLTYISKMLSLSGHGMKSLLLDNHTTQSVSVVASQTWILSKEIYLIQSLEKSETANSLSNGNINKDSNAKMPHLKCIMFLRPTQENITKICTELSSTQRFSEYHIFFSNLLPSHFLSQLADADAASCLVRQIHEFPVDTIPVNQDVFSLNLRGSILMARNIETPRGSAYTDLFNREVSGLKSLLLQTKRPITCIRYSSNSAVALKLAREVSNVQSDDMYHFQDRSKRNTQILIIDRSDDPITPLLSQWTYQGMIHELLGVNNSRVILKGAPGVKEELEEVVLSSDGNDTFWTSNLYSNFGELGENLQALMAEYQKNSTMNTNIKSIEDMQNFMERFPQFKAQSHNVSKHVAILGELARIVDVCDLMDVSAFEQDLACIEDPANHLRTLISKLQDGNVKTPDKLRLGLLYCLRYESSGNVSMVKEHMSRGGVPPASVNLVDVLLRYGGVSAREKVSGNSLNAGTPINSVLYGKRDTFSRMSRSVMSHVQGVSNVYSQHVPLLMDTIQKALKGTNKTLENSYPCVKGNGGQNELPKEVFVYIVGGVTYEEARVVGEFNRDNGQGVTVLLGGSVVLNSRDFLEELNRL